MFIGQETETRRVFQALSRKLIHGEIKNRVRVSLEIASEGSYIIIHKNVNLLQHTRHSRKYH